MRELSDARKRYVYVRVDYRPHLMRTVSHYALRVMGALNYRISEKTLVAQYKHGIGDIMQPSKYESK